MKPVAVVILTWNARRSTEACFRALRARTEHPSWRVIVVDNGSTDGTVEWLRELDWLTLIENGSNLGFSRACNIGIGAASPEEDVVLMNNDLTVTDPAWLSHLQDVAYADPANGVVGSRLVDIEGLVAHLGSYLQPITLRGQQMGGEELFVNQCPDDREVESVVFALTYLRRDCIDAVGALDEELFAYFEDTDYCLRAARAGFRVMCAGATQPPVHVQNTSTKENALDFWSVYTRSQKIFGRNWATWLEHDRYENEITWHSVLHRPLGYAVQSRQLMKGLHFSGSKVAFTNAYGEKEEPPGDLLLDDLVRRRPRRDVTQVGFCQADAFQRIAGRHKIGWTMLEVTGLPREWVDGCNTMDEVWVPASFNVETFRRSGVRVPMRVMPLGVDVDYFNPQITSYRPSSRFTFLSVFEWGERKAPEVLLRAFATEFDQKEDAVLLLSVFNRDPAVDVEAEVAKLDLPPSAPIVLMVNAGFASHQMGALYRSADCFVLPSRGEGWGMPVLEAMACGLPAIATNWSGPADFIDDRVAYPLDVATMVKAEARCPYYEGFEWAEPDFDHLMSLMRRAFEYPDEARAKGLAAASQVAAQHSWRLAVQQVEQRLKELV